MALAIRILEAEECDCVRVLFVSAGLKSLAGTRVQDVDLSGLREDTPIFGSVGFVERVSDRRQRHPPENAHGPTQAELQGRAWAYVLRDDPRACPNPRISIVILAFPECESNF